MQSFFDLYLTWAGPNVSSALFAGTIAWWLYAWRRTGRMWPHSLSSMLMATGGGVLAMVVLSGLAALFGVEPLGLGGIPGIIAGVISGSLIREKA